VNAKVGHGQASRGRYWRAGTARRRHRDGGDQSCKTNPVSGTGADRTKQSQFPAGRVGRGLGSEGRGGQSCKTNPIWPPVSGNGRAGRPRGPRPKVDCAKRTQFPPPGRSCETKPIWLSQERMLTVEMKKSYGGNRRMTTLGKQSQFTVSPQAEPPLGSTMRNEPNSCHRDPLGGTKPIRGGAGWVEATGARDGGKRAKRTQFAARPVARASCPCHYTALRRHYEPDSCCLRGGLVYSLRSRQNGVLWRSRLRASSKGQNERAAQ
jgi:hypothetical protein